MSERLTVPTDLVGTVEDVRARVRPRIRAFLADSADGPQRIGIPAATSFAKLGPPR